MNAFLSNVPGCWASIVSTLAALACPARSSAGASAASCASLAFDAAGGWARLRRSGGLHRVRDLGERLVGRRTDAGRGDGRGEQLVVAERRGRRWWGRGRRRGRGLSGRGALRADGLGGLRGFRGRADLRHRLGRRHGLLGRHRLGPEPGADHGERRRGRLLRRPVQVDRHPGGLRRLQPLLDGLDGRLVVAHLAQRRVDVAHGLGPGDRIRPASSALTAAFPAERCSASSPGGRAERRSSARRRPSARASSRRVAALSGVSRAPPIRRASRVGGRDGTAQHATFRARRSARKGIAGSPHHRLGGPPAHVRGRASSPAGHRRSRLRDLHRHPARPPRGGSYVHPGHTPPGRPGGPAGTQRPGPPLVPARPGQQAAPRARPRRGPAAGRAASTAGRRPASTSGWD